MIGTIIGWVLFGLVVGGMMRWFHPGDGGLPLWGTMLLGLAGALVGGGIGYWLEVARSPYEPGCWITALLGAMIMELAGGLRNRPRLTL